MFSKDWKEWLKTLGQLNFLSDNLVEIFCDDNRYLLEYKFADNKHEFKVANLKNTQQERFFLSWLKIVLKKSAYCIGCQICESNCPNGYIHMNDKNFYIDDKCTKCKKCYEVEGGCVVATSQLLPKENKMSGTIDQYKSMGVRYSWVIEYLQKKDAFWDNNSLGSEMIKSLKNFLRHAEITEKNKITSFGEKIAKFGGESPISWALMLCNLVYTPQFNWWLMNTDLNYSYSQKELDNMLKDILTTKCKSNVIHAFKNTFYTNPVLSKEIGFGIVEVEEKGKNTHLIEVCRKSWENPEPLVILYSLYKFAEKCGEYYQFSLATLLDDTIERDGVSPTRIFGLNRETMIPLLNGLSANYPSFINVSFTLGLDTITLREDKKSEDVLNLF